MLRIGVMLMQRVARVRLKQLGLDLTTYCQPRGTADGKASAAVIGTC